MVLKGLIGGALLSIAIPVFAVGMATGVLLARKPKRHPECKKCCMMCNSATVRATRPLETMANSLGLGTTGLNRIIPSKAKMSRGISARSAGFW